MTGASRLLLRWGLVAAAASSLSPAFAQSVDDPFAGLEATLGGREPMGWGQTPALRTDEAASELDRLSSSPSGRGLSAEIQAKEVRNVMVPVSVTLRALDKITATYEDLTIPVGAPMSFGALTLLPRTCDKRPPEETPETTVFLEVFAGADDIFGQRTRTALAVGGTLEDELVTQPERGGLRGLPTPEATTDTFVPDGDALFRGWMFASSPSLNALEHPVYDVWVIDCKMVDPET